jgi:hypothetical protein
MLRNVMRHFVPLAIAVAVRATGSVAFAGSSPGPVVRAQAVSPVNADKVDGFDANSLARVAMNSRVAVPIGATAPIVSATIYAPTAGYVLATATATVGSNGTCPSSCFATVQLHDLTNDDKSTAEGTSVADDIPASVSVNWVFPVAHGKHVIRLEGSDLDNIGFQGPTVTLLYVPFGAKGERYQP